MQNIIDIIQEFFINKISFFYWKEGVLIDHNFWSDEQTKRSYNKIISYSNNILLIIFLFLRIYLNISACFLFSKWISKWLRCK